MLARLAITPLPCQLRVALAAAAVLGAAAAPWLLGAPGPLAALAAAMTILLGLGATWALWPRLRLGIGRDLRGELPAPPGQAVRLSFDDGPTPGLTDAVLDLLAAEGIKASFFVLLPKARAAPHLVRRIVREGHTLGLHGADHRGPFLRSRIELLQALTEAREALGRIAGQPVALYRPSHGWKTPALLRAVRGAGLQLCFWDQGVWDTDAPPLPVLLRRLRRATPPPGAAGAPPVVLLHDGHSDAPGPPPHAAVLLQALGAWLPEARAGRPVSRGPVRLLRPLLGSALGAALLGWFFRSFDAAGFAAAVRQIPLAAAALVVLMGALSLTFQGLRFATLFPAGLAAPRHVLLTFALATGNVLLPFRGGELVRPLYIRRWRPQVSLRALVTWSVADRVIEAAALLPVVALGGLALPGRFQAAGRWASAGLGLLTVLGLALGLVRPLRRRLLPPAVEALGPRRLLLAFALSLGVWAVNYVLFLAVVPEPRLALALLLGVNVSLALPSLPAGIGAYEATFLWVGQLGGLPREQIMAAAVASHALQILTTLLPGVPLFLRWGWPRSAAADEDDDAPPAAAAGQLVDAAGGR